MMQTSIPVPAPPTPLGPCRWCGSPAVGLVEVEKPRWRLDRGVRVMAKAALEVPACREHIGIVDRQLEENHAYVRRDATATSRRAAVHVFPHSGTQRKRVLGAIWRAGHHGATRDELARNLNMSPNTVRPRVRELLNEGWITVGAMTRPSDMGEPAEVLMLTDQAYQEIDRRIAA